MTYKIASDKKAYTQQWYKNHPGYSTFNKRRRMELGLCLDCMEQALPGSRYCLKHVCKHSQNAWLARQRNRKETFDALGGGCIACGIKDYRVLQLDHVDGKGAEERRQFNTTGSWSQASPYRRHVMSNLEQYQLLCANCHMIKTGEEADSKWLGKEPCDGI